MTSYDPMRAPPSTLTPDTFRAILERIADGELTDDACEAENVLPRQLRRVVARNDPDLTNPEGETASQQYAAARTVAADALAEDAVRLARNAKGGSSEEVQADRLAYDALKWLAGVRRPKEYGTKVEHEVSGTLGHLHLAALQAPEHVARLKASASIDQTPALPSPEP